MMPIVVLIGGNEGLRFRYMDVINGQDQQEEQEVKASE